MFDPIPQIKTHPPESIGWPWPEIDSTLRARVTVLEQAVVQLQRQNVELQRELSGVAVGVGRRDRLAPLTDGHGSSWPRCSPDCTLSVTRPGKDDCDASQPECPNHGLTPEIADDPMP